MQPTARAASSAQEHTRSPSLRPAAGGAAAIALGQQRQQWEARLASFQRGLDHVMRCGAGDACGSSLCHATKRLMRTYATHDCTNPPGASANPTANSSANECKVCKLWGYILTKNKPTAQRGQQPRWHSPSLNPSPAPVLPPLSCGLAQSRIDNPSQSARGPRGPRGGATVQRRVVVTPELIKAMAKRV